MTTNTSQGGYTAPPSHTSRSAPSGPKQSYQVYLLDGHPIEVTVSRRAKGEQLLQEVFNSMNPPLEERDYFSLTFDVVDEKEPIAWLNRGKGVDKQMKKAANPAFAMNVKFYPPDPTTLMEYSRYLFYLQIRDDVAKGKLPCSLSTLALLGSFVCQADQGDYTADMDLNAIHDLPLFSPHINQAEATILLERILTLYRTHRGMTTAEAELNYLEVAKKLTLYGVTTKPCSDQQGVRLFIGVNASGVIVFREHLRLNRFAWAKVIKISYKKNDFSIHLLQGDYDGIDRCVVFKMDSQKEAKSFWKTCIEHHQFFRLLSANPKPRKIPFGHSHPTLIGQTEYQIKNSATLNRNDTFARNTLPGRRTQTLPNPVGHAGSALRPAPPSPQSGEYEPRRHEQIHAGMRNSSDNLANGGDRGGGGYHNGTDHLYSIPSKALGDPEASMNISPSALPPRAPVNDGSFPNNGDIHVVQQHATVTTTVHTSIRMPPNQPPPRVTTHHNGTENDHSPSYENPQPHSHSQHPPMSPPPPPPAAHTKTTTTSYEYTNTSTSISATATTPHSPTAAATAQYSPHDATHPKVLHPGGSAHAHNGDVAMVTVEGPQLHQSNGFGGGGRVSASVEGPEDDSEGEDEEMNAPLLAHHSITAQHTPDEQIRVASIVRHPSDAAHDESTDA